MARVSVIAILLVLTRAPPPPNSGSSDDCNVDVGDDSTYTETIEAVSDANNGYVRHIVANGCPNYATAPVGENTNDAADQGKDYEIAAYPCFSTTSYDVTCIGGAVGITLNGISVLSYFPGTCGDDAIPLEGDTFDSCGGHSTVDGNYHYHVTPPCLLDHMGDYYDVTEHSPLIGWAFDGFPIYGPHTTGGAMIYPCGHSSADSSRCLDTCGGTEQYEIDGFLYHYHMVGPLGDLTSSPISPLPDSDMQPYTIGCLKGVVYDYSFWDGFDNGGSCDGDGYNSTYTATATDGVTDVYVYNAPTAGPTETVTSSPTPSPTSVPTTSPVTPDPSPSPITSEPTLAPSTKPPTRSPVTESPTAPTVSRQPTTSPTTSAPATLPITSSPSMSSTDSGDDESSDSIEVTIDENPSEGVSTELKSGWLVMMAFYLMLN